MNYTSSPSFPQEVKEKFFSAILGLTPMIEFEQWVYSNKQLTELFPEEDYLTLLALNYKDPYAPRNLRALFEKYTKKGELERYNILQLLLVAQKQDARLPSVLMELYDLYCDGYDLLQDIAIAYGLPVRAPMVNELKECSWDQLSKAQQEEILKSFSPGLEEEIERLIALVA